jgi:hypothetical protein
MRGFLALVAIIMSKLVLAVEFGPDLTHIQASTCIL